MENIEKNFITVAKTHNIREAEEKSIVLSDLEKGAIIKDLENGVESPLVQLVRLPFPDFVSIYYKRFPNRKEEANDPNIGYKMYIIPVQVLKLCAEYLKGQNEHYYSKSFRSPEVIDEMKHTLVCPLEDLVKKTSSKKINKNCQRKYIYIMQYVTAKKAEELGLESFTFKTPNGYRGFDLEGKLDCFNEGAKEVLYRYFGLNGHNRLFVNDISEELGIPSNVIDELINLVLEYLYKSTGELKHMLKVKEETLAPGVLREYFNYDMKSIDIRIQTYYIANNISDEQDREFLKKLDPYSLRLYVARKYMFTDEQSVKQYLYLPYMKTSMKPKPLHK